MDPNLSEEVRTILPRYEGEFRELAAEQLSSAIQFGCFSIRRSGFPGLDCALGYRRWSEFDPVNGPGQDAAALRTDGRYIVGIVSDGVSQSFFGEIASRSVTSFLLRSLWDCRSQPLSARELEERLKDFQPLVDQQEVRTRPLPSHIFEMQRDALEATRESGSQTVFSAFILDVAAKRVCLYQVGDVDAIVVCGDGEPKTVRADPKGRWSSAGKSDMRLDRNDLHNVVSVVLRSDGTGAAWGSGNDTLYAPGRFAELARQNAEKDDLSYVSVRMWNRESESQVPVVEDRQVVDVGKRFGPQDDARRLPVITRPEPLTRPRPVSPQIQRAPESRRSAQPLRNPEVTRKSWPSPRPQQVPLTLTIDAGTLACYLGVVFLLGLITGFVLSR